jgi:hypothetical protein
MEVRVCHRCKVYVTILESYEGTVLLKKFEQDHRGHPIGTLEIFEAGNYTNVDEKYIAVK